MRSITRIAVAALVAGTTACSGSPTPSASDAASSPSVSPSGGQLSMELTGDQAVLAASALGDYGAVLPAAYFVADGVQHAYLVGFGEARGDQAVFHATSTDGLSWEVDEADPFAELGIEFTPPGPIPASVTRLDEGSWAMYLWGTEAPAMDRAALWRATAATPVGPWVADPEPVIPRGEPGAWNDLALDFPSVVRTADGYLMLFSAVGSADRDAGRIGAATSPDGVSWTPLPDPVIEPGLCGAHDAQSVAGPRLLALDDGLLLLYAGYPAAGSRQGVLAARSDDGRSWTCASAEPLLVGADVPGGQGVHTFSVASAGGRISVLVESLVDGGSELWAADLVIGP